MPEKISIKHSPLVIFLFALIFAAATNGEDTVDQWWSPGDGKDFAEFVPYSNEYGLLGVYNEAGNLVTKGHPFFEAIGSNGRACVTCHQPSDGMSLSLNTIRQRWDVTNGKDPLFAAIDGKNCPHLPQGDPESHSLLLNRGLIRVALPWPPKAADGSTIEPQFTLEVVRDPTGCNTHPAYGLNSDEPMVSVYRRPRPLANMKYVVASSFGISPFVGKNAQPANRDPETGEPVQMNLMADAREPTLRTQANNAALGHLQTTGPLTKQQLDAIEAFELQVYAAQNFHFSAGNLEEEGGPSALGPRALAAGREGVLGNNTTAFVFPFEKVWHDLSQSGQETLDEQLIQQNEFRESVARGHDIFMFRNFWIRDAMHMNTVGIGNPMKRTCATCHGMHMMGMDTANGWMDLGTTNHPWASEPLQNQWLDNKPDMPLFKLTCNKPFVQHPFLGKIIYTQDPGRALISGRCDDIGAIVIQQMRALAARPPYFSNGSAKNLREVVDFYDRRFNIQYTEQEKQDLINFMSTL